MQLAQKEIWRSAPHSVAGPSRRTEKLPAEGQAPCRSTLAQLRAGATSLTRACAPSTTVSAGPTK